MTKMSQLTINDGPVCSKFPDDVNFSDDFGDRKSKYLESESYSERMFDSRDKIDQRLLQLFKIRRKQEQFDQSNIAARKEV